MRRGPGAEDAILVEDSDDEEVKEVESLKQALQEALGACPCVDVSVKLEDPYVDLVGTEPGEKQDLVAAKMEDGTDVPQGSLAQEVLPTAVEDPPSQPLKRKDAWSDLTLTHVEAQIRAVKHLGYAFEACVCISYDNICIIHACIYIYVYRCGNMRYGLHHVEVQDKCV